MARWIAGFHKEDPSDTFRGWLRTITRNKVYDHLRRESRHPHATGGTTAQLRLSELPAESVASELAEPPRLASQAEEDQPFRPLFHRALQQIEDRFERQTWQAFWRVVVEGKTAEEVARELSMRPGTVRVAKSRVLHRLRKELGELAE